MNNWLPMFSSRAAQANYDEIEDVTVTHGSVFARIFGYRTVLVQTAGTRADLEMSNVPSPTAWADWIATRAREVA